MNYLVVRADWDGEDKTPEFLTNGIWENVYKDYYTSLIPEISIGDRIAIKAVFQRKQNLPSRKSIRAPVWALNFIF